LNERARAAFDRFGGSIGNADVPAIPSMSGRVNYLNTICGNGPFTMMREWSAARGASLRAAAASPPHPLVFA
jgi:hypothetical protein